MPRASAGFLFQSIILGAFILVGYTGRLSAQQPPDNLAEIQGLAAAGNAESQYQLARLYSTGNGVPKDFGEAAKLFRASADQGYVRAQLSLGNLYFDGHGVPQDYAAALEWYRKAAAQGSAPAQYNIGQSYRRGLSVKKDDAEAVAWYQKSAEQGYVAAQFNLGVMYFNGWGIQKNVLQAYVWFNLAAAHAKDDQVKQFAADRDRAAKKLSAAQLAEGQRLASEWKPKGPAQ